MQHKPAEIPAASLMAHTNHYVERLTEIHRDEMENITRARDHEKTKLLSAEKKIEKLEQDVKNLETELRSPEREQKYIHIITELQKSIEESKIKYNASQSLVIDNMEWFKAEIQKRDAIIKKKDEKILSMCTQPEQHTILELEQNLSDLKEQNSSLAKDKAKLEDEMTNQQEKMTETLSSIVEHSKQLETEKQQLRQTIQDHEKHLAILQQSLSSLASDNQMLTRQCKEMRQQLEQPKRVTGLKRKTIAQSDDLVIDMNNFSRGEERPQKKMKPSSPTLLEKVKTFFMKKDSKM